jgi:hypothetical protein
LRQSFEDILSSLSGIRKKAEDLKEILLANLVMAGEIPAPTFHEDERIEFLMNRFKEAEITKNSVDEVGNGIGILEGEKMMETSYWLPMPILSSAPKWIIRSRYSPTQ